MSAIEDRERAVLIDLSRAESSTDALRQLELTLGDARMPVGPGGLVDINTGDLLLSPGVLAKMNAVVERTGGRIATLYSDVPQTQQSALDEGLFVRRRPPERKLNAAKPYGTSPKFDPGAFVAEAYRDLDLPFEKIPPAKKTSPAAKAEPLSRLSVTLDDGTREEVKTTPGVQMETVYYRQTLRSGQVLEANGNIVVVGDAHSGSEILADGDIVVWGFLGGIAHAGRKGHNAEIRALRIEAVQLRIGPYIARRPDRLFKAEDRQYRGPEVAKVRQGEIQIYQDVIER